MTNCLPPPSPVCLFWNGKWSTYGKNKNSKLYQALADAVMRANWEKLKEGLNMCEALKELFADDFKESELKGRNAGRTEGAASKIIEKVIKKHQKGYTAEDTADMLEEPVSRIRQIYDVIEKSSPDYDAVPDSAADISRQPRISRWKLCMKSWVTTGRKVHRRAVPAMRSHWQRDRRGPTG